MSPTYDPERPPDAREWLALDESEKWQLVEEFHAAGGHGEAAKNRIHALVHVIVETQAAAGDAIPVAETIARLIREGLSRHEAVHAVGSVLAMHIHEFMGKPGAGAEAHAAYFERLRELTADAWRARGVTSPRRGDAPA